MRTFVQAPPVANIADSPPASITILRANAATTWLNDQANARRWTELFDRCPWATAFQSHGFVGAFYAAYAERFTPLLIVRDNAAGELDGLFPLAINRTSGRVVAAAAWQAEYQCWLGLPDQGDEFAEAALAAAADIDAKGSLCLRFLPPQIPLKWIESSPMADRLALAPYSRPLMILGDGSAIRQSLNKSNNRRKFRIFGEECGEIRVRPVNQPDEFAAALAQAAAHHDLRHGALYGIAPFTDDPHKADFHRRIAELDGVLCASLMTAGEQFVSLQIGLRRGDEVQLCLLAHNPAFSSFSPGKFHLYHFALQLLEDGVARIDLTSGGEGYKDRFATDFEPVAELTLYKSASAKAMATTAAQTRTNAKSLLIRLGCSPGRLAAIAVNDLSPLRLLGTLGRWALSRSAGTVVDDSDAPREINLHHLLKYRPSLFGQSRRAFLSDALCRIEQGQWPQMVVKHDRLMSVAWHARPSTKPTTTAAKNQKAQPKPKRERTSNWSAEQVAAAVERKSI